jgi:recombination protein RecA
MAAKSRGNGAAGAGTPGVTPISGEDNKDRAIALAVSSIEKQFGKGAILTMTQDAIDREVEAFSTGAPSLDLALGIGGLPRGRVVEIYGPESSGKTTLALHAVAEIQRRGGIAAFIDAEHALDIGYARRLGVKVEDLLVSQPDTGEQALEIVDVLLRSGAIDLVVVDSVAALTPRAEIEGEMGDHHVGLQARLMSQALRKLTGTVSKSNSTVIFINVLLVGPPRRAAHRGAQGWRRGHRQPHAREGGQEQGRAAVPAGRVRHPLQPRHLPRRRPADLLDLAVDAGIVEKSGAWYSYEDERVGQGRENARKFILENPDVCERISDAVYAHHGLKRAVPATEAGEAAEEAVAAS